MANNKLYLVDKETKEYVILCKGFGFAWCGGLLNDEEYRESIVSFLESRFDDDDYNTNLIIGHENDTVFMHKYIIDGQHHVP